MIERNVRLAGVLLAAVMAGEAFAEQARGPFPELEEAVEKFDPDGEDISASYDGESRTASLSLPAGSNILRLR